jgi:hypothetical protein
VESALCIYRRTAQGRSDASGFGTVWLSGFALGSGSIASAEGSKVGGGRSLQGTASPPIIGQGGWGADQGCIFQEEHSAEYSAAVLVKVQQALEHLQQPPSVQVQQPEVRPGKTATWRLCKGSRRQVLLEMKWRYGNRLNSLVVLEPLTEAAPKMPYIPPAVSTSK